MKNNYEYQQMDIFSASLPPFKFKKPIKMIELFAGYGSQLLSLKYLGADAEHFKICEWSVPSIEAYNDIHTQDFADYSKGKTKEWLVNWLSNKGISLDYNQPATFEQIKRKPEEWVRRVYNNIIATNNLVDVTKTHGKDFYMEDRDKYDVFMTYSFPCQDLSLAGNRMGMDADSGTRSSMIWQVGRILREMKEMGQLPDVLMAENVPQLISNKNLPNFNKWLMVLEELGYHSYYKVLKATDFGIPQTRKRCFVVSILDPDCGYEFPTGWKLDKKLKDFLEKNVDEKYFITKKLLDCFLTNGSEKFNRQDKFIGALKATNLGTAGTLVTREGRQPTCNFIIDGIESKDFPKSKNEILKGFELAYGCAMRGRDGGKQHIEMNGDEVSNTITTVQKDSLVAISKNGLRLELKNVNKHLSETIERNSLPIGETKNVDMYNRNLTDNSSTLVLPNHNQQALWNGYRIRRLTPRECFRLMGVKDEDFDKVENHLAQTWLYHLAGDSIVTNVMMAMFKKML